jgi:DMSO/TMAO reductase YedYZ heme-binding membrane subunit
MWSDEDLMLLPLAITSTSAWQRRLKRRWITLHQLIYPAAILGAIHYLWLVKADTRDPLIYLAITLGLLAFRLPTAGVLSRAERRIRDSRPRPVGKPGPRVPGRTAAAGDGVRNGR